jgi:hypothetical protein
LSKHFKTILKGGADMVEDKKPTKKRGPKKGAVRADKVSKSVVKVFQKEYDKLLKTKRKIENKLNEEKKKIEKKMMFYEKSSKEMGFKLAKRLFKIKDTESKAKGKHGRKKKEVAAEGKSE